MSQLRASNALWLLPEQASDLVVGLTSDRGYKLVNERAN
jgi:hypothetical protein